MSFGTIWTAPNKTPAPIPCACGCGQLIDRSHSRSKKFTNVCAEKRRKGQARAASARQMERLKLGRNRTEASCNHNQTKDIPK